MQPICHRCAVLMRCKQNDFIVADRRVASPNGGRVFPSTYWRGDLFECPRCEVEVVVGFGRPFGQESATKLGAETQLTFDYQ